jgi:putative chitinase
MVTINQLYNIMPNGGKRIDPFVEPLNAAMAEFSINTPARQAAFIAQIAHESGEFRYVEEIASGAGYEGRKDLGNTQAGDGKKFKGHGLIQVTGRANHKACGEALGLDLITNPRLLCEPLHAARSAAWFWYSRGINKLADAGDFRAITKKINGGFNGLKDRELYHARAKKYIR